MTERQRGWLLPPMALMTVAGILLGRSTAVLWPLLCGCGTALAACLLTRRFRFAALLVLSLCIGSCCGSIAWHPALPEEGSYEMNGVVCDQIRTGENGQVKTVLRHLTLNGTPYSSGGYWSFYADEVPEDLRPGCFVSATVDLYRPSGAANPDGYDFREELLRQGITVGLYGNEALEISDCPFFSFAGLTARLRAAMSDRLIAVMSEEAGAYAATMLLGLRQMIPAEDRTAFARLGIAHILAVSGFHVGLLMSFLELLFRLLRLRPRVRLLLSAPVLGIYAALCGSGTPVLRASLLLLLAFYGRILNRPRSGLHLLSACAIVLLWISPVQLTGLSFQLSFGAMLGLTLVSPFLRSLFTPKHRFSRRLWQILCAGIGAQLGILLPQLSAFQELPLLSLLINIPVSFLAGVLLLLYWLTALCLPFAVPARLVGQSAAGVTALFIRSVRALGQMPGITLWTCAANLLTFSGVLLLFAGLTRLVRLRKSLRMLLLLCGTALTVFSVLPRPHSGTEYIQFAVGNADAAVIWDQDTVIAVDTGEDDGVLSDWLHRRRLTPDAVILTHLHADHAGGLRALLDDGIPLPLLYLSDAAEMAEVHESMQALLDEVRASGTEIRFLNRGDVLALPSGEITVLWPEKGKTRPNQDANDSSMALYIMLDGVTLFQAGDLTGTYEMYAAQPADLLKMAHHGSSSGTGERFLETVNPQAVLLSCNGADRPAAVRERLGDLPLYATGTDGALTVRFERNMYRVETFLPANKGDE